MSASPVVKGRRAAGTRANVPSDSRRPERRIAEQLAGGAPLGPFCLRMPLWNGVLVLGYHRIFDGRPSKFHPGLYSATVEEFDWQLKLLARRFDLIGPHDVPAAAESRGRSILLTFDDGYRDNYELAFPLLRRHRLRATFFLTTGFLDRPRVPWWDELAWMVQTSRQEVLAGQQWWSGELRLAPGIQRKAINFLNGVYGSLPGNRTEAFLDFCGAEAGTGRCDPTMGADLWMTWAMAAEMREAGMSIGGHTVNHPVLARLTPDEQRAEIADCRRRIEQQLGIRMHAFAYPLGLPGTFDEHTRAFLEREGVSVAFSFSGGRSSRSLDRYSVPRANVSIALTRKGFRSVLALPELFTR